MNPKNFKPFKGEHCETTATGTLLNHLGMEFSEAMLFGLGEGFSFATFNMKTMKIPFIGGRIKTGEITQNLAENLNLNLDIRETTSIKKAWNNIKEYLDQGIPVGLQLDCYHLEYFTKKNHFAGHFVAIYDYDNEFAYLVDTDSQGHLCKTSLKSLELARNEKGPMASKNLSYTLTKKGEFDLNKAIETAISNTAKKFLNPPIRNLGYKGIMKVAENVESWFKTSKNPKEDFKLLAMLMEKAGTGGALFRNIYRDFLKESHDLLKIKGINQAYEIFIDIAPSWTKVSSLFDKAGDKEDISYLAVASEILKDLSNKEMEAMEILLESV